LGICGGYQMLGQKIIDQGGIEGPPGQVAGLGHLLITTHLEPTKTLASIKARHIASGEPVKGYEIHLGRSTGPDTARAWLSVDGRPEGAVSADGRVLGCYLHGLFSADGFRKAYLEELGARAASSGFETRVDTTLDALAQHVETHLDLDRFLSLAE